MRRLWFVIVSVAIVVAVAGGLPDPDHRAHSLRFPIGRSAVTGLNQYSVFVDGVPVEAELESDGLGGYWATVGYDPSTSSHVTIRFIATGASSSTDGTSIQHDWLAPSRYIDADDAVLVRAALDAAGPYAGMLDRAAAIQAFVATSLEYREYDGHPLATASETLRLGYGTCVNHARLFVALSRAAGIPARTVWGVVHSDGVYDYHHEWAEVCDEHGRWHQLDPLYPAAFDLDSAEYLDLVYAPEENPLNPFDVSTTALAETDHIAYDTSQVPCDGRLGFVLVERDELGRFVIENTYPCPGPAS